ncbi:MAG: chemotaxis protein CheX [Actinomycetota bacterium]|nr:chemotaxis protein CheX [Actinomycetota bacterium]
MTITAFELSSDDVVSVIEQVWESFLGEPPLPDYAEPGDVFAAGGERVTALISVTGGWDGHVVLETTVPLGVAVAAVLMGVEEADVESADVADAVGELVNIIGGFIKSLAPGPSALSLPLVLRGRDSHTSAPDTAPMCRAGMNWRGEPVVVTVLSATDRTPKGSAS